MFRLLRVRPPNGWAAVGWELGIVIAGVLIALAVQQWADGRAWADRAAKARAAIDEQFSEHIVNAIEWRLVEPCVAAQLDRLADRVDDPGDTLRPVRIIDQGFGRVIRAPSRSNLTEHYEASTADGAVSHFPAALRNAFASTVNQARLVNAFGDEFQQLAGELTVMAGPLRLDPGVRFELLKRIERGRQLNNALGVIHRQIANRLFRAGVRPTAEQIEARIREAGSIAVCRALGLPLRPSDELFANTPIAAPLIR
ncbi:hypothetical protein [Sphingomonas mesophila]|uniref:hypothetical protein n=1 Tax=Sphingomonas mesophila TaxID=2303576 RepID=UPI000E58DFE2|nr:hypothetical protein [Sphingomonas mesophila]